MTQTDIQRNGTTEHYLRLLGMFLLIMLSTLNTRLFAQDVDKAYLGPSGGYVKNQGGSRVIIFVHGLWSNPNDAWRCDADHYWPEMIAHDTGAAFLDTDVYVVGYPTRKKHGKMTIADLETGIMNQLDADGVFQQHREVIFVAHSLGGLLTQQLLLTYKDKDLAKKVRFIYFFGTPEEGSKLANIGKYFSTDPLLKELQAGEGNFVLQDMNTKWLHAGFGSVHRYCGYETQSEGLSKVVSIDSATRGCEDTLALDTNHRDLVKPCTTRAPEYLALENKLRELNQVDSKDQGEARSVTVEPFVSLDKTEAFQQQFTVTNSSSDNLYGVHYACTVQSIVLVGGKPDPVLATGAAMMMLPYMKPIERLNPMGKTTIDCDYLVRYGAELLSANIEIDVAFRIDPHGNEMFNTQAFSGRRAADGSFIWTYGSPFPSYLVKTAEGEKRLVAVQMFGGENRSLSPHPIPEESWEEIKFWGSLLKQAGCTVFLATTISGNYE
jgi:pimeloyl-ACP methyl ester carboxylesterase